MLEQPVEACAERCTHAIVKDEQKLDTLLAGTCKVRFQKLRHQSICCCVLTLNAVLYCQLLSLRWMMPRSLHAQGLAIPPLEGRPSPISEETP